MKKAVIDRIVDGKIAVLLIDEEEAERHIDVSLLPADVTEGSYVFIVETDGEVQEIKLDQEGTTEAKETIQEKMARLRKRMK